MRRRALARPMAIPVVLAFDFGAAVLTTTTVAIFLAIAVTYWIRKHYEAS